MAELNKNGANPKKTDKKWSFESHDYLWLNINDKPDKDLQKTRPDNGHPIDLGEDRGGKDIG